MTFEILDEKQKKNLRKNKGSSLLLDITDYTVIDLETTGFNSFYGEIIELSAIKVRDNKIVDVFESLIKPVESIAEYITEKNGITNEMVTNSPDIRDILPKFLQFISDDIIVAHNANFDINFIYDYCEQLQLPSLANDFIDTLRIARLVEKDFKDHKLNTICSEYKLGVTKHRGLSDAKQTYKIYEILKGKVSDFSILFNNRNNKKSFDLRTLSTSTGLEIDKNNYFYNKTVCFTGKMNNFTKKEAAQILVNLGAVASNNITKKTDILILGNMDYQMNQFSDKSSKHKKAEKLGVEIMDENHLIQLVFE